MTAVLTGPGYQPDGRWKKPTFTLGWQVLQWMVVFIRQPDGPDAGGDFRLTQEQVRFVLWWYALDERGRFLFSRGVLRRAKGWGKSPLIAALALAELCGPVRFDHWDAEGEICPWSGYAFNAGDPVGVPVTMPWVQLAGTSEKQTQNTMTMVLAMVNESPIVGEYGLDIGLTRVFTADGGKLEPITSSSTTAEGARPTAVFEDETHHWTDSNGGVDLDRTNRRNLGKSRDGAARNLETTNAHVPGERSVAEKSYDAYLAMAEGRTRRAGLLYDAREAPPDVDLADEVSLTAALADAYGDSTWVDLERLRDEVWDPSTPPEDSRRFYLNQIAGASDSWLTEPEVKAMVDATKVVAMAEAITMGFDGSRQRARGVTDSTSLMGCRLSDGHLFELGIWEQPEGPAGVGWQVPKELVDATVRRAFEDYRVVGFYADPAKWETYVAGWEAEFGHRLEVKATRDHPIEWWMTGGRAVQVVRATEQLHTAIVERQATFGGELATFRHLLNARRRPGPAGVQIAKEHPESARKIDAAVTCILAFRARMDAVAAGVTGQPKRSGRVYGF